MINPLQSQELVLTFYLLMGNGSVEAQGKVVISTNPDGTREIGKKLGLLLGPGDLVALAGPLGAGKTVFVKGMASGLGVEEEVTSPSFNIVIEYRGRAPFYHVDFYRLGIESEAIGVGVEEYIYGEGVTAIEWADRFPNLLPPRRLDVRIDFGKKDQERVLMFMPHGKRMEEIATLLL